MSKVVRGFRFAGIGSVLLAQVAGFTMTAVAATAPLTIPIPGKEADQWSAVASKGDLLVVGADEKAFVHVLRQDGGELKLLQTIPLLDDPQAEADVEALAVRSLDGGDRLEVFVAGCHCRNRKKPEDDKTLKENLARLEEVKAEPSRTHVYRFVIDAKTGKLQGDVQRTSLLPALEGHKILGPFTNIASKENGVDVEGLAVGPDGKLYTGFRGPVLRENYVPVLVFDFKQPAASDVRFVNLQGLGIRDMVAVQGGFLLLAGPVGDGRADFRIFFWDGVDGLPGKDRTAKPVLRELREVPTPEGAKAEGLAVLTEEGGKIEVLVVYDGPKGGNTTRLSVTR